MKTVLTKIFDFSASHSQDQKVFGHNYRLSVTVEDPDGSVEALIQPRVESTLIRHLHSRDLTQHVDFLKGMPITGPDLLRVFWPRVEDACRPARLLRLRLERDKSVLWTLEP